MMRILLVPLLALPAYALERPGVVYKVFQFPADNIPRIDGDAADWEMVPEDYSIGTDQLKDTSERAARLAREDLDVKGRWAG